MVRRLIACLLAISFIAAARPARADEPSSDSAAAKAAEERDQAAASRRRVFIYSGYGVGAIGLGLSFLFLAQASSALSDREDIARANGSLNAVAWQCYSAEECQRMREGREDWESAKTAWAASMGLAIAGATMGTVFLVAHYFESQASKRASGPRLSPAVSHQGGGLQLQGTF